MLSLSVEEQFNNLKELILEVAQKATDEQYVNLCKTNLKLASSLDEKTLKAFLKLRMGVSSSLSPQYQQKDSKLLKKALDGSDENIKKKIEAAMQNT